MSEELYILEINIRLLFTRYLYQNIECVNKKLMLRTNAIIKKKKFRIYVTNVKNPLNTLLNI